MQDQLQVERLQHTYVEALHAYVSINHPHVSLPSAFFFCSSGPFLDIHFLSGLLLTPRMGSSLPFFLKISLPRLTFSREEQQLDFFLLSPLSLFSRTD